MVRRHHLNQKLSKRHDGRPVSIRSRFVQTPLTKNGKDYRQTPGHRDNGPTRRRQARAVRDRARVAKREIRLRTRTSTLPHTSRSSNRSSLSRQYLFKSTTIDRGCPRPPRRSNSGTDTHHRVCVRDQEQTITKKTSSTFSRKLNQATINKYQQILRQTNYGQR